MDYDNFLALVKKRRSTRRFKSETVPDEYVDKIIGAACWAPSGANSQPWEFIVIKNEALKSKITEIIKEYRNLTYKMELTREPRLRHVGQGGPSKSLGYESAPVFIILCGDTRTKEAYPTVALLESGQSVFYSSLANAFLYMQIAVSTLGLGSQWASAISDIYVSCLVKDLLGIPKELEIYDMMALGYPASEPKPRLVRNREEMVHYDGYDRSKFRTQEQVNDFIADLRKSRRVYSEIGIRKQ
jgi:nitroreductase